VAKYNSEMNKETGKKLVNEESKFPFRTADNSKAKKILKWKPKINFNNLVEEMVESDLRQISDK